MFKCNQNLLTNCAIIERKKYTRDTTKFNDQQRISCSILSQRCNSFGLFIAIFLLKKNNNKKNKKQKKIVNKINSSKQIAGLLFNCNLPFIYSASILLDLIVLFSWIKYQVLRVYVCISLNASLRCRCCNDCCNIQFVGKCIKLCETIKLKTRWKEMCKVYYCIVDMDATKESSYQPYRQPKFFGYAYVLMNKIQSQPEQQHV